MSEKINILDDDFEDSEEPSLLSSDPNERKLARRLRIQKRAEAIRKQVGDEDESSAAEESLTDKQIVASAELLEKLLAEGNEVITNVRVANDARELERRKAAREIRVSLLKRLEESAQECKARYDLINERWASILESNDPLDIHAEMVMQKEKCDEVLAKKDAVIMELKLELQRADENYFDDQNKQKNDISLLIERIENQMSTMENVYARQLELIEKTLRTERDALVSGFQKKWDALYKQQEDEDLAGDKQREEIMREYEEEMERVMTAHDEEYRVRKIELERECQALQQQVEKTKALCLLNAEKLSYNYNVLKSREEENSIVKSQQKRKINRLQTLIGNLQKNYSDLEESTQLEIEKLSNQIVKTHQSITELEEKSVHFTRVNEKQYLDIWKMNEENANELVNKILTADKMIHERILGILWEPPKQALPKKEDLPSYCAAMNFIQKQKQEEGKKVQVCSNRKLEKSLSEIRLERQLLNNILKQISNCSGYLIEDKLQKLISYRSEEEQTIIRLDSVFQALSISCPEEIDLLLDFFLPYSYCPTCSAHDNVSSEGLEESSTVSKGASTCSDICEGCNDENVRELIAAVKKDVRTQTQARQKLDERNRSFEDNCRKIEESNTSDAVNDEKPFKVTRFQCNRGHVLEIQAAYVTKALREMISQCSSNEEKQILSFEDRLKESKFTISRNLSIIDVQNYWSNYREIFGSQKEKLWDAVLIGLNKYYEVLKERHNLCCETENLKKQNIELQRLLESHTTRPEENFSLLQVYSTKHSAYK